MITIADDIEQHVQDNEIIIFNLKSGEFYGLQDTSYFIWNLITLNKALNEIINEIKTIYQVEDDAEVEKDVVDLICQLEKEGLIIIHDDN